ncbi:MAG: hypothetical protein KF778_17060 [Rhodocyclaceae bacterium]|nr:hypothetical protein [Rhodocyclaceae bacterium]
MTPAAQTRALRKELAAWAAEPEWALLARNDLLRHKPPQARGHRWYRRAQHALAMLGLVRPHVTKYSWLPTLKHAQPGGSYRTLMIWAPSVERDTLRRYCEGFVQRLQTPCALVPVLVTDVSDFAYFSRLRWLVEYVPELSGDGPSYRERKLRYLAWRYRDALVVPAALGTASPSDWEEVMRMKL